MLTPKSALALSLALHELATNAAKFGSLSVIFGHVKVEWHIRTDGGLGLIWTESSGPVVAPPIRRGFGTSLIERALALETGGRAVIRYEPSGVVCTIDLPRSSLVELSARPIANVELGGAEIPTKAIPASPRILIVEDSFMVILTLEAMCEDLGWEMVGPATRLDEALELARTQTFDAALLDVNLDGEMTWAVADVLKAAGIPFAFCTGYEKASILPDRFASEQVMTKPYRIEDVARRLRLMMAVDARSGLA